MLDNVSKSTRNDNVPPPTIQLSGESQHFPGRCDGVGQLKPLHRGIGDHH